MPLVVATLNPAKQRKLKFGSQFPGDVNRIFTARFMGGSRRALALWRQVQKQQRAFRQQGLPTSSAQVVQQRQQHQCDIASTAEQAFNIDGQLHHRAGQCVETVFPAFTGPKRREIGADRFHLFGEQCCAVGLGDLERAAYLMQELPAPHQGRRTAPAVDTILKREMRVANGLHQLVADDRKRVRRLNGGFGIRLFVNARFAAHVV